jgi:hypothetical protein
MINTEPTAYCTLKTMGGGRLVFMLHSFMFGEGTVQHRDIICEHTHLHPGDFFSLCFSRQTFVEYSVIRDIFIHQTN